MGVLSKARWYGVPVNYLGHAIIAAGKSQDGGFVLGAMLPDLANIIGAPEPRSDHPSLQDGLRFHHETDRVFHSCPSFLALQRQAHQDLAPLGLRRGSRLAVAHVGIEMLLDVYFATDTEAFNVYQQALADGARLSRRVAWRGAFASFRFRRLLGLLENAAPAWQAPFEPGSVAKRLEYALAARPLLALRPEDRTKLTAWAADTRPAVFNQGASLLRELQTGLHLQVRHSA